MTDPLVGQLPTCDDCGKPATAWPILKLCRECVRTYPDYATGDDKWAGDEGFVNPGHPGNFGHNE